MLCLSSDILGLLQRVELIALAVSLYLQLCYAFESDLCCLKIRTFGNLASLLRSPVASVPSSVSSVSHYSFLNEPQMMQIRSSLFQVKARH